MEAAIRGERDAFVEAQQRIPFLCANSSQQHFIRLVFDLYMHVVHALVECLGYGGERFLDKRFKRSQSGISIVRFLAVIFLLIKLCFAWFSFEKASCWA